MDESVNHCGSCTLCCKIMGVPELEKPMNTWCSKCDKKKGCTIYSDRPQSCVDYECGWLQSQKHASPLPIDLRPNNCHALIDSTAKGEGVVIHVDPNYPDAWKSGMLGRTVQNMIKRNEVVIIAVGQKRRAFLGGKIKEVLSEEVGVETTVMTIAD